MNIAQACRDGVRNIKAHLELGLPGKDGGQALGEAAMLCSSAPWGGADPHCTQRGT